MCNEELTLAEEKKRLQQRGRDLEVRLRQLRPGREASDPEALHPALGRQRRRLQQMEAITRLLHEKLHAHDHETGTGFSVFGPAYHLDSQIPCSASHAPKDPSFWNLGNVPRTALNEELLSQSGHVPSAVSSCASESRLMLARANQIHRFSRRFLTIRDTL